MNARLIVKVIDAATYQVITERDRSFPSGPDFWQAEKDALAEAGAKGHHLIDRCVGGRKTVLTFVTDTTGTEGE